MKQYKTPKYKWKKDLKALRKQNIISKESILRCELKKIKNIKAKASKKCYDSRGDSSSNESYSNFYLPIYSDWDE